MRMQQNFTNAVRIYKQQMNLTLTEFSNMLEISRSAAQEYLKGKGNPTLATVEHFAEKLKTDPLSLVSGGISPGQYEKLQLLFELSDALVSLAPEDRRRFAGLLNEIMLLFDNGE